MNDIKVKFIVSEGVENQGNGFQQRQTIVNPVLTFATKYMPTSLSIAITMVANGISAGKHQVGFKIINCTKEEDVFDSGISEVTVEEELDNFVLTADLKNIGFENEGEYKVTLKIDGELFYDVFNVRKVIDDSTNIL